MNSYDYGLYNQTSRVVRMRHEAEAAERRAEYTGAKPEVELPHGLSHPLLVVRRQVGKRRWTLSNDVRAWLSALGK